MVEPMAQADTFDQDWEAAQRGDYEGPTGQSVDDSASSDPTPRQPGASAPDRSQPAPAPTNQPAQEFQLPAEWQNRMREVGAQTPDELFQLARQFQSIKGQLPNLEQRWRDQYVTPIEQERDALRAERQQALDTFVRVNPQTGQPRSFQEQQQIQAAIQQAEAQKTQQAQAERVPVELQQREQQINERAEQVNLAGEAALKIVAINSIPKFTARLAEQFNVPQADLDAYVQQSDFSGRVDSLPPGELKSFGFLISELTNYAKVRATQVGGDARRQAVDTQRYRDVGTSNQGGGGQSGSDRWTKANGETFDKAWERALAGELV